MARQVAIAMEFACGSLGLKQLTEEAPAEEAAAEEAPAEEAAAEETVSDDTGEDKKADA